MCIRNGLLLLLIYIYIYIYMGSKCSCSYANIFMDDFETKYIYPRISRNYLCYLRFVEINTVHDTFKFDCQYSFNSINFLDTAVYKNKHNSLSTKLFTKPTDRLTQEFVPPNSLIKNIPYGQALRVKRICSEETDLQEALDELKKKFQMRGYNNVLVE